MSSLLRMSAFFEDLRLFFCGSFFPKPGSGPCLTCFCAPFLVHLALLLYADAATVGFYRRLWDEPLPSLPSMRKNPLRGAVLVKSHFALFRQCPYSPFSCQISIAKHVFPKMSFLLSVLLARCCQSGCPRSRVMPLGGLARRIPLHMALA